jgi:uncharacterized membrane protein YtjA (UPF0391 family)
MIFSEIGFSCSSNRRAVAPEQFAAFPAKILEQTIREQPRFRAASGALTFCRKQKKSRAATRGEQDGGKNMLSWSITLLVIALVAALLGFTGIAGAAAGIAKILFGVFLVLFVISLLFGRRTTV